MTMPPPNPDTGQPSSNQPLPPLPAGPLNAPVHGPRLPGHPGPGQQSPPQPQPRQFRPTLPVKQTDYTSFWRVAAWSWWQPIVALLITGVGWLILTAILFGAATAIDIATGRTQASEFDPNELTPLGFIGNNLGLAALIGLALFVSFVIFKQRPGYIISVLGRMRWRWLARCFLLLTPLWLIYMGAMTWWEIRTKGTLDLSVNSDTWLMLAGILLTTPLQAAGEEFGFRGVVNRSAASFFANPKVGFGVGALISSLLFMSVHAATDPWLNVYYFVFGLVACLVTWRTGGLEAAIAMHAVNNLVSLALVPFSDFSDLFNREAGVGDPSVLIGMIVMAAAVALLLWQAKRNDIAMTSAPGASMLGSQSDSLPMPPPRPAPIPGPVPPGQPPQAANPEPVPPPLTNPRPWQQDRTIDQR